MKQKTWLRYVGYLVLLVALIILHGYVGALHDDFMGRTYGYSFTLIAIGIAIKVCIGLVLGFEYLTNEMKKVGSLKINLPKIIVLVIPSLILSISLLVEFLPGEIFQTFFSKAVYPLFQNNLGFISIFQVLLGYFLITSFYKTPDTELNH